MQRPVEEGPGGRGLGLPCRSNPESSTTVQRDQQGSRAGGARQVPQLTGTGMGPLGTGTTFGWQPHSCGQCDLGGDGEVGLGQQPGPPVRCPPHSRTLSATF